MNAYTFWNKRLSGETIAAPDDGIAAGYFRYAYWQSNGTAKRVKEFEAVAFWQDEGGEWCCARTKFGDGSNMNTDQMRELFASCCKSPVSYEVYTAFVETGAWPEDAAPAEIDGAQEPDNASIAPDAALAAELAKHQSAAREWLTALGHKPQTQEARADVPLGVLEGQSHVLVGARLDLDLTSVLLHALTGCRGLGRGVGVQVGRREVRHVQKVGVASTSGTEVAFLVGATLTGDVDLLFTNSLRRFG